MEPSQNINILLRSLPGLPLPRTTNIVLPASTTISSLLEHISTLLPPSLAHRLTLTASTHKPLLASPLALSTLTRDALLPLTLHAPLPGGKGGFGSQLRAAGGRMSARKRKNALASDPNNGIGSNRNLDGRRLRTVTEAKQLAEYLARRPEEERKEREVRRKRWEAVMEASEREGEGKGRIRGKGLSDEWLEDKEEVGERTREAVRRAMEVEEPQPGPGEGSEADMELDEAEVRVLQEEAAQGDEDAVWALDRWRLARPVEGKGKVKERKFVGFDEDDEFVSSSEDGEGSSA